MVARPRHRPLGVALAAAMLVLLTAGRTEAQSAEAPNPAVPNPAVPNPAVPNPTTPNVNITYSEIKLGVWAHDVHFLGGKEHGTDINPEVIFGSPVADDAVAGAPFWLHWLLQPRPTLGAGINTNGDTDQFYIGGTWSWFLLHGLINPDDGIVAGIFFGPGFNDGEIRASSDDRKALGSHVLFREALDLGYQINPIWEISVYLDHISNGGLAKENQSINDLGIRVGFRF